MGQRPRWHHFSKLPVSFLPPCHFPAPEFKQKEECTIRGRNLIQISIQEDPWNLPNSIKTLVDNIQRYVEGQSGREGCHVAVLWPPVLNVEHGRVHLCAHVSLGPGRGQEEPVPLLRALGQYTRGQGTAHLGCPGPFSQNQEAEKAELVPSQFPKLWIQLGFFCL